MKVKVKVSIGLPVAIRKDTLDIDDDMYNACETDIERELLIQQNVDEWVDSEIDVSYEIVE